MITGKKVLVTGGAGFIGTNLCEALLQLGNEVVCFDNFSTGHRHNVEAFLNDDKFSLFEGDIRNLDDCKEAVAGCEYVLHQAALGSVPRSIKNPIVSNEVNVSGFLNVLVAAKDEGVKRVVYAASSSTYGDSKTLPKVEDKIGRPLSPYAITKFVNELYADVFFKTYGLNSIGLRYFNVFGRRQDPNGAYAAVIPKFISQLMNHESPTINGDGEYSRDFTYIDNVIQMNLRALSTTNEDALNQVFNTAYGQRSTLNELVGELKLLLSKYDESISKISINYGGLRPGDIPHSLASIEKGRKMLGYDPEFSLKLGLAEAIDWYWENLKKATYETDSNG